MERKETKTLNTKDAQNKQTPKYESKLGKIRFKSDSINFRSQKPESKIAEMILWSAVSLCFKCLFIVLYIKYQSDATWQYVYQ